MPAPLATWNKDLDRIEKSLSSAEARDEAYLELMSELVAIRKKAAEFTAKLQQDLAAAKSQLDKLGPAPKEGEPPESEAAARLRKELAGKVAELDGMIKAGEVLVTRAAQISSAIQDARRRLFSRQLFKKVQSPLTPALWRDVLAYTVSSWSDVASLFSEWWKGFVDPQKFALIAVAALLLWAILFSLARRLLLRVRTYEGPMPAPFLRRAASAGGATLT
ncbi:MAG: DUF3772 domain-containing protein, partial [Alphaproteobacteria bacterium]